MTRWSMMTSTAHAAEHRDHGVPSAVSVRARRLRSSLLWGC
ncbi:hypothetical protein FM105_09855 [Brevibacterium yomogidense]|uniref:Uncharacterized protein n=1 Tax=Brevibacterium yomogidense TaxID=946573 RepID=A0A1X6XI02_9MICO|nr:hypothetical protein FM105_09855 [Brevibacterium yomogidense]